MPKLCGKMSYEMMRKFRRNPRYELEHLRHPSVSWMLRAVFTTFDRRGQLSDLAADPQRLVEAWWPYRFFRRKLGAGTAESVSVVVATHNNQSTIHASLASLMKQTVRNLEIIVVDDGSTDKSAEIIEELARQDNRIRVITNVTCIGTGASRNIGMEAATGKYLTFQDGDDVSDPTRIERQLDALSRDPSKKLVTCNYVRVNSRGERLEINDKRIMKCIISMLFPREDVLKNVGFFQAKNVSEDSDYYERIRIFFGKGCDLNIFRTLYEAQFRENSSFFSSCDDVKLVGRKVQFERKKSVVAEWDNLLAQHEQMRQGSVSPYKVASPLK